MINAHIKDDLPYDNIQPIINSKQMETQIHIKQIILFLKRLMLFI